MKHAKKVFKIKYSKKHGAVKVPKKALTKKEEVIQEAISKEAQGSQEATSKEETYA